MGKLNNCIGIRQKEISQKVYARPAYLISHKTECKVYQETKCGIKTCCFECVRRFVCRSLKECVGVIRERHTKTAFRLYRNKKQMTIIVSF